MALAEPAVPPPWRRGRRKAAALGRAARALWGLPQHALLRWGGVDATERAARGCARAGGTARAPSPGTAVPGTWDSAREPRAERVGGPGPLAPPPPR